MAEHSASETLTKRFKTNLRGLIASAGMTQREFADKLGLPYNWVRKSCNDGIARPHPKNEKSLKTICNFFHQSDIDFLWGKRILGSRWKKEDLAEQNREFVDDLNWLLKEFPDDHNVAEVQRVIGEVVELVRKGDYPRNDATTNRQTKLTLPAAMPRAERFKANLRYLIEATEMTQKAFAERIDIPYIWLRKSCTNGVTRLHLNNYGYIRAICDFFALSNTDSLWDSRLTAKEFQSIDDVTEAQQLLVSDLIWLLKEHGDTQDRDTQFKVGEVKRLIAAAVKHLYVPPAKSAPPPDLHRSAPLTLVAAVKKFWKFGESFTKKSPINSQPPATLPLSRDIRPAKIDRKGKSFRNDEAYLDDQIDGIYSVDDEPHNELDFAYHADNGFESWFCERMDNPTDEGLKDLTELGQQADSVIRTFPRCHQQSLREDFLLEVYRGCFNEVPPERLRSKLKKLLVQRISIEFIDGLPLSLKSPFTEAELTAIVHDQLSKGVPSRTLRSNLNKLAQARGMIADPEILKRKRRIRRRRIRRKGQK